MQVKRPTYEPPKMFQVEQNRAAIARAKAEMLRRGDLRLERQVATIVSLVTGVKP